MSKADTLLKKATFFERMALYSDRKAFLQALSQDKTLTDPMSSVDPSLKYKDQIEQLFREAFALIGKAGKDASPLQRAWQANPPDLNGLIAAINNIWPTISPLANSAEQDRVRKIGEQLMAYRQTGDSGLHPESGAGTSKPAGSAGYPAIDKGQQEALGRFLMVNGITFVDPKKLNDGKLGPETRKGLEAFKQWYNAKATGKKITSDAEALQLVKYIVDNDKQKYGG